MKLILSTYLRTMKERDEFDVLIPDLLQTMGITPITKGQRGTSQSGVDLAAVGPDITVDQDNPTYRQEKLFLFVLKQGDIDRRVWNGSGEQSVQPSMDEIFNVYLRSHIPSTYAHLPTKIVLGTTGEMKEHTQSSWSGYTERFKSEAQFAFWGANEVAGYIETHMFNEHLFKDEDRTDLRRTLALIGEQTYSGRDFDNLLRRQLGLNVSGEIEAEFNNDQLHKALVRINMAVRMVSGWACNDGDTKAALEVSERALLWSWHRLLKQETRSTKLKKAYADLCRTYAHNAATYFKKIQPYCLVRDGLAQQTEACNLFTLTLFEHIGLLASIGLFITYCGAGNDELYDYIELNDVADALVGLIKNNPATSSPRLDGQSIDITLAMTFLLIMDRQDEVIDWLRKTINRTCSMFYLRRGFPVDSDNVEDLIELDTAHPSRERREELMQTSWLLPTLAGWCGILDQEQLYGELHNTMTKDDFPNICRQLWHPVSNDTFNFIYYQNACRETGECEAPIEFEADMNEYTNRMRQIMVSERHQVLEASPAHQAELFGIDFIASRHFRNPIAPSFWYRFLDV